MKYLIFAVAVCCAQWADAESFAHGKRYICNITSAAGWTNDNDFSQFEIMKSERQYIIEPTDQDFLLPKVAVEGFLEMTASHSIKVLGQAEQAATVWHVALGASQECRHDALRKCYTDSGHHGSYTV